LFSSTAFGTSAWNCARTVSDMMAPDDDTLNRDDDDEGDDQSECQPPDVGTRGTHGFTSVE
ncbi:hypothetical protein, partial [Streptomyces sp. NPDC001226]